MKQFTLNNGQTIPALGLGTWKLQGEVCKSAVREALAMGYRYIDTAQVYGNQKEIGEVGSLSTVRREELFITSKVFRNNLRKKDVLRDCDQSLRDLKTDYVDLYLIHWPNREVPMQETFEALMNLKKAGKIRAFGVSNFTIQHLEKALTITNEIVNNQVEFHPSLNQEELKNFCDKHNILITAYSPIAQGRDLSLPAVLSAAQKYNRTPAQVILNWIVSKGMNTIPRSKTRQHLEDNMKALEWTLEPADIKLMDEAGGGGNYRVVNPDFNEFDWDE